MSSRYVLIFIFQNSIRIVQVVKQRLNQRLANRVVPELGLCMCVYDIVHVGVTYILPGEGQGHVRVKVSSPPLAETCTAIRFPFSSEWLCCVLSWGKWSRREWSAPLDSAWLSPSNSSLTFSSPPTVFPTRTSTKKQSRFRRDRGMLACEWTNL